MLDLIKKTLFTGVGLAAMTADKIEELARELVQKGELSEKDGRELVDDLLKRSEEARKEWEKRIKGLVQEIIEKANLATQEEVENLAARIERLEKEGKDEKE